ncbi:MAG: universal stress protein [Verrucomicrobia bacterium]|jgi:universal stress protein E|nr:universal stress protein [Verrucomicrobiota bacterium]
MKRFEAIAVLVSETPQDAPILRRALNLAKNNKASLSLYSVFDEQAQAAEIHIARRSRRELLRQVKLASQKNLKMTIKLLQKGWLAVGGKVLIGKPFIRVIQEVLQSEHDLLMLGAEKRGTRGGAFMGSTAMHLLRKCPCAVWVFRPGRKRKFRRIMAAVNVAADRREEMEMNVKILELANSLALQDNAVLHIVNCRLALVQSALTTMGTDVDEYRRYDREAEKNRRTLLHSYLERVAIDKATANIHMLRGDAAERISRLAEDREVDLIVMGTVGRSGIPGFFIGNTAEKILNSVTCSVLAVKPTGFISPVTLDKH